jgi:hypothetical protein
MEPFAMSSIRVNQGCLFFDFRYQGVRCREYTKLPDTFTKRTRMQWVLDKIDLAIATGSFNYSEFFRRQQQHRKVTVCRRTGFHPNNPKNVGRHEHSIRDSDRTAVP